MGQPNYRGVIQNKKAPRVRRLGVGKGLLAIAQRSLRRGP